LGAPVNFVGEGFLHAERPFEALTMTHPVKVLLIDPNAADAAELRHKMAESKSTSFCVSSVESLSEGLALLENERFDIALMDSKASAGDGAPGSMTLKSRAAGTPFIVISGAYEESQAMEAVRSGAQDYVLKSRLNTSALERILLYGIERQRAQKRTSLQYSVSRVLAESETLAEAGESLLRVMCEFLEFDLGQFWHSDRRAGELVCAQSWHSPSRSFPNFVVQSQEIRFSKGLGLPGRVSESGAPAWICDVAQDANFPRSQAATWDGLHGAFAFPIILGEKTLGVMEFLSRETRESDEELLKVVADIGHQVGQFMARKLAEEERENVTSERLLILDSASEGIYGIDLNGCITFMNRSAASMFGCVPAEVLGKNSHELFHHTHPDGSAYLIHDCPIDRVLEAGEGCRVDDERFWRTRKDSFAVDYSAHPVRKAGKITGAVICFNDITARKTMEIELRHAQKLESVGGLAAGIAHEINTPIQFVGDNTRFLQDAFRDAMQLIGKFEAVCEESSKGAVSRELLGEVDGLRQKIDWNYLRQEIPKALEQMLDGIGRVATIVRAMKEFSHVDQSAQKTPADLNKALESTLIVARNELKYVADVEEEYGSLVPVVCHLGDLNQVFLNLLVNAAHAIADVVKGTSQKGRIGVRSWQDGDWVEVSISDSGTGIPEGIREKVFDPFFTTKEVGKGTGQGLALARAIVVEKHGGTLTFQTEMGKGTTFHVRLPVQGVSELREAVAK
jgi:PAS domain S-box-containing protein